jgi:type II secretory pathway pseudopilin PulG
MNCSKSKGERSKIHALGNSSGFAYIALLVIIIIIGISLSAAGKYWSSVKLREKEEELLFRGDQYRQAIEQYFNYLNRRQYPQSIDDLLKDSRSAVGRHYLRQKFKDPITGEDFVEIKDPFLRIIGVHSSSDKLSLKQAGFPDTMLITGQPGAPITTQTNTSSTWQDSSQGNTSDVSSSSTATIKYSDWLFVSNIKGGTVGGTPPGGFPPGGTPPGGFPPGGTPPGGFPPGGTPPGGFPPGAVVPGTGGAAGINPYKPPIPKPPATPPSTFINR